MKHALFLSVRGDLHASVIAQTLERQCGNGLKVSIVDMDTRSTSGGLAWRLDPLDDAASSALVKDNAGNWVALDDTDLVWCRRFTRAQRGSDDAGFLTGQWNAAGWSLAHLARTRWIDRPRHIVDAENKALQLRRAHEVGFRVPRTLISQDFEHIRGFARAEPDGIVVKPLKASTTRQIYTVDLSDEAFERPEEFGAFPAIYQQKIRGDRHLRIVCLPHATIMFAITCMDLDWRRRTNIDIQRVETDGVLEGRCSALLRSLKLSMGVFDLKIQNDEPYFLEVNPQGQFLFLEALTGVNLRHLYADYFQEALR